MNKPSRAWARRFDKWIRAQGFSTLREVAAFLDFSYDSVVRWRRGDILPCPRNKREIERIMKG